MFPYSYHAAFNALNRRISHLTAGLINTKLAARLVLFHTLFQLVCFDDINMKWTHGVFVCSDGSCWLVTVRPVAGGQSRSDSVDAPPPVVPPARRPNPFPNAWDRHTISQHVQTERKKLEQQLLQQAQGFLLPNVQQALRDAVQRVQQVHDRQADILRQAHAQGAPRPLTTSAS